MPAHAFTADTSRGLRRQFSGPWDVQYFSERGQGEKCPGTVHPPLSMDPLPLGIHNEYLCGLRWHLVSCLRMPQIIEKWIVDCSAAVHLLCSQ